MGPTNLLLVSVVLLELAALLAIAFYAAAGTARAEADATRARRRGRGRRARGAPAPRARIGGSVWAGATHVARNRRTCSASRPSSCCTTSAPTVLYFAQTEVVGAAYAEREARTELLARVEFLTQLLTALTQAFLTGRVIRWLGLA